MENQVLVLLYKAGRSNEEQQEKQLELTANTRRVLTFIIFIQNERNSEITLFKCSQGYQKKK